MATVTVAESPAPLASRKGEAEPWPMGLARKAVAGAGVTVTGKPGVAEASKGGRVTGNAGVAEASGGKGAVTNKAGVAEAPGHGGS